MKNHSVRYPLLTFVLAAAAGCGGSDSMDTASNDPFAFDASAYKPKPGSTTAGSGTAGSNGLATPGPNCGDSVLNPDEECDGTALGGKTCATATMGASPGGNLVCRSNCTLDVTGCTTSGPPGTGSGGGTGVGGGSSTGGGSGIGAGGGP